MVGEVTPGSAGPFDVPALAKIREETQGYRTAHAAITESLTSKIDRHVDEIAQLTRLMTDVDGSYVEHYNTLEEQLTATAIELLTEKGRMRERFTDECYGIFANWAFESETGVNAAIRTLVLARQQVQTAPPNTLVAKYNRDDKVLKLWKPTFPVIGSEPFRGRPAVAIRNPIVRAKPETREVTGIDADVFNEVRLDELNGAVIICSDDLRVEKLLGLQKIHSLIGELSIGLLLPKIETIVSARNALGLSTDGEEVYSALTDTIGSEHPGGEMLTKIRVLLDLVPDK